jgi:hypothetical protein
VPIVACVERNVDDNNVVSLDVTRPSPEHRNGFPASLLNLSHPGHRTETPEGGGTREPKVPRVKMFRREVSTKFLTKKIKLEEELECPFTDVVDFGEMKLNG